MPVKMECDVWKGTERSSVRLKNVVIISNFGNCNPVALQWTQSNCR